MSYLEARGPAAAPMQQVVDIGPSGDWEEAHRTAQAELATAAALARLGPGWRLLHSLPVGPGPATLAHLVLGPGGVFAVSSRPRVADRADGGGQEELAEVRQLAQRVRAGLGRAVDAPTVHPLLCLTDDEHDVRGSTDTVAAWRVFGRIQDHQGRLTSAEVQRLTAAAVEPATWGAPASEWFAPDLPARYDAVVRSRADLAPSPAPQVQDDGFVTGRVTASRPPQLPPASRSLRTLAVLMVLLGMASLLTFGLASLPTLVLGGLVLRHHGGWWWCNAEDASLVGVGMGMAALPLLGWLFVLLLLPAAL
ncbi:MAG: hypothetical protein M3P93_16035 [Actinomycetota bacterium]|jgi:hypothetical protein|nr:hypothetical protein [Actinomycetota bacterium]MDP9461969.1 hypothetical protein [Actinomycetota bacterium]